MKVRINPSQNQPFQGCCPLFAVPRPPKPLTPAFDPNPQYTKFKLPLPHPPGLSNLPDFLIFKIDTRFTPDEVSRIKTIINSVLAQWNLYYTQKFNNNGVTTWGTCVQKYAFNGLTPVWRSVPVQNALQALDIAMNQFTRLFRENGFKKVPPAKITYLIPTPATASTIYAPTATKKKGVTLSIIVNPLQIDRAISTLILTGSLIHAWLHRAGWVDPANRNFTTYFIGEAPMCVMRGYQNKVPTDPDTTYSQFFD